MDYKEIDADVRKANERLESKISGKHLLYYYLLAISQFTLMMGSIFMVYNGYIFTGLFALMFSKCIAIAIFHDISHGSMEKFKHPLNVFTKKLYFKWWLMPLRGAMFECEEIWSYGHNKMHHYSLSEEGVDSDLHEINLANLVKKNLPKGVSLFIFAFVIGPVWQYFHQIRIISYKIKMKVNGPADMFDFSHPAVRVVLKKAMLPYALNNLIFYPAVFYLGFGLNPLAVAGIFLAGDLLINMYSFPVVTGSHNNPDLPIYKDHYRNNGEMHVRTFLSTVNHSCDNIITHLFHLGAAKQIEHHLFPRIPFLLWKDLREETDIIAKKYNQPFRTRSLFANYKNMLRILWGEKSERVDTSATTPVAKKLNRKKMK